MKKKMILLAGFPGTGKTYIYNLIKKQFPEIVNISFDVIKENEADYLGYNFEHERKTIINNSWRIYFNNLGKLMEQRALIASDYPFSEKQLATFKKYGLAYGYEFITIRLIGDIDTIYERQKNRDLKMERHLSHIMKKYHQGDVLKDRSKADDLLSYDEFYHRCTTRGYDKFVLGKLIEVDTTDFSKVNYSSILDVVKRWINKGQEERKMYKNLSEVLKEANELNMAIGAFNTHNLEMLPAIIKAAVEENTPVIIQTSCGTANYVGHRNLVAVCKSLSEEYGVDVVLHLDHAKDYNEIRKAIDAGYSSVMFDGSSLPLKENILGTKRVVNYAKKFNVSVEAELGIVGGTEDGLVVANEDVSFTDPADAIEFVKQTGIDALAVAIGTSHGQYKSKTNINFERLAEIKKAVNIPLVIHGGTGVKDEDVKRVIDLGIRKFNVGTELLVGWNKKSKELYDNNPENISNREDVVPALEKITEIVKNKIKLFKN